MGRNSVSDATSLNNIGEGNLTAWICAGLQHKTYHNKIILLKGEAHFSPPYRGRGILRNIMMKRTIFSVILIILIICALGIMGYAGYNAYIINKEYEEARNAYESVANDVVKPVSKTKENNTDDTGESSTFAPWITGTIESSPITIEVDFQKLLSINDDIVGWLYCDGGLNYPVVQGKDNSYYLRRFYDKTYSYSGIPFLDCRHARDFSDKVNLIYGHNMRDGSMFSILEKYKNSEYMDNNREIQFLTPEKNYVLHVLACKVIKQSSDFYDLNDDCLDQFLSEDELNYDKYFILSTCSYEYAGARIIVICWAEEIALPES